MLWYVLKHNLEYCEHKLHIPIVQFQSRMINSQRIPTNGTFHSYFLSFKMNIKYNICVRIITYSQSFQTWYLLYLLQVHKKICLMLSNDNKTNDQLPILSYTHLYFTCRSYHNNVLITERRITEVNNKMFLYWGLLKWICTYFSLASNILNKWIKRFSVCMCQGMHVKVTTEFSGVGSFFSPLVAGLNSDFQYCAWRASTLSDIFHSLWCMCSLSSLFSVGSNTMVNIKKKGISKNIF